jgi:hypothetical protein
MGRSYDNSIMHPLLYLCARGISLGAITYYWWYAQVRPFFFVCWCVVCGVVVCGVLVCGVWCVVCGVWCVVCGVLVCWCVVFWCVVFWFCCFGVWCVVFWCLVFWLHSLTTLFFQTPSIIGTTANCMGTSGSSSKSDKRDCQLDHA